MQSLQNKVKSLKDFYKLVVMNQVLKKGRLFHRQTLPRGNNINILGNQIVGLNAQTSYCEDVLRTKMFYSTIIQEF